MQARSTLNHLGQRVIKAAAGTGTTHFRYGRGGHLIAASDGTGAVQRAYVFLGDTPVAFVTSLGIDFIHADEIRPGARSRATSLRFADAAARSVENTLARCRAYNLRRPAKSVW